MLLCHSLPPQVRLGLCPSSRGRIKTQRSLSFMYLIKISLHYKHMFTFSPKGNVNSQLVIGFWFGDSQGDPYLYLISLLKACENINIAK